MKYIDMLLRKYGEKKTGIILLSIGIAIGILVSKILKSFYWDDLDLLNDNYFKYIQDMDIDYKTLGNYVLLKDFKNFILIWGLSFTKIGIASLVLIILYYGIEIGFFISVIFMGYGLKGLLLIIGYTFPQIIIYIPVFILSLKGGYWLCRNLYFNGIHKESMLETVARYGILIIILALCLVLGALLETYVGSFILVKILSIFK